ncbi:transcriptional regulator [Phytohabitans rumicis]|uniref:Transcriptional regulator n=1 Tax=Phytohabitans rumicis TaxID=1076125 RepID=A0A6V8LM28_9ACTN|nr:transcriptional regulator [Phytohabitans rumicis]
MWLTATDAGRQVPFAALAALMPASSCADVTVVLPAVREALRARAGSRRLVLVVDDAHLLDGPSAAVLLGLAGEAQLVLTICAGAAQPDAVRTLWKDGYLDRVDLDPFDDADTGRLVAALVGGDVAAPTAQMLHQWTRGNAFYLTELVRAGLLDRALRERSGLWWWQAPLVVPPTLAELLDRQLNHLDAAARDALSAVALGAPLAVEVLERIVAPDVVVRLEDRGLLRAEAADGGQAGRLSLRFAHPMLGAAVRRRLSPARRRRVAAALLAARPSEPVHPGEVVLTALWQLDAGTAIDGGHLLDAADLVLHSDPALSLRLSEEAARRQPSALACVASASALVELGRPDEARAVLEKAAADASSVDDETQIAIALAGHRVWAERDPAGGQDELTRLLASTHDPAARADIGSLKALVHLFGGQTSAALEAADSVLADGTAGRRALLRAGLARAAALSLVGRTADALRAAGEVAAACVEDPAGLPYVRGMALAAVGLAQIWRTPAPDVPATHPQSGRWPTPSDRDLAGLEPTAWPLFDGYARRVAGDLPGAIKCLRVALVQQAGGEGLFRSEAATWLVLCLAEAGRVDEAEDVLRSTPPDAMAIVPGLSPWAAAGIAAARGERRRAIDLMAEAGAAARRAGCWLVEVGYLVHEAGIRGPAGAAEVAARLRAAVEHVDAPRLVAAAQATLAVASDPDDGTSLIEHVDRLERLNMPRHALGVVRAAEAMGNPVRAVRAATGTGSLTARESEIAGLAASGLTDREIAERLVLSVRTVESHLARVYRKLPVRSRRQLREALRR